MTRNPTREIPLADEPPPPRKRGRRPKAPSPDMPPPVYTADAEREQLANWWRKRMEQIETEHEERIESLRNGGEHPTPAYARQVRMCGALGMEKSVACKMLGISLYTIETHYADEYITGAADTVASVAANMIRIGTSTTDPANAKVGMDILSRRGGQEWRPPAQKVEMETEVKEKNVIDSSRLSFEERQQLRLMIERVQTGGEGDPVEGDGGGGVSGSDNATGDAI
jgi:hypothetical protein